MKNRIKILIVGLAICCGAWLTATISVAETITLTFATQEAKTTWGSIHALSPWIEKIGQATQGKVKIKVYSDQILCEGPETWDMIARGIADMGWCFHGYWAEMAPLTNVITLPGLSFKTAEKGSETLWQLYETYPQIRNEFKDNHILLLYTSNPYILITTKKRVRNLRDLQGMKIRMPGGPPSEQVKALGGIPVLFPMPKNYDLLKSGVIDGMGAPWEAIYGHRLYEVVKYYTEVPFSAAFFSIAMNKKRWESLPSDIQEAINKVSGMEGSKFWGRIFFDSAKDAVQNQIKERTGKEIDYYVLPEDERSRWLEIGGKPIWQDWITNMKKQGYSVAPEILDTVVGN